MKTNSKLIKHSVICKTHGPFLDTEEHCFNISRFFSFISNAGQINHISAWFDIASGITEVKYISGMYDESVMWCKPAIEYEDAKSEFHSKLICELTRFNFIWSGLEAFVQELNFPSCPRKRGKGKYCDVNYFLKTVYLSNFPLPKYHNELITLIKVLIAKNDWYGKTNELFAEDICTSKDLLGLKVVYSIRNKFAHGKFHFSEPHEYNSVKPYDIPIIISSCKIVLLYIQMLCVAYFKDGLDFYVQDVADIEEGDNVKAKTYLLQLHLKEPQFN